MGEKGIQVLILGSKEFPVGTGDDPLRYGGMEAYVQQLVEHLRRHAGVTVVTRRFRGTPEEEHRDNLRVCRVPWIRGRYLRNPSFNFFAFLRSLTLEFDVVLTMGVVATLFGILLGRLRGMPVVACPSGVAWTQPQYGGAISRLLRMMESVAYRHSDAVVFLSEEEMRSFHRKLGFLPERCRVIKPGVEAGRAEDGTEFRARFGLRGAVLCFAGRLVKVKGVDVLLRAVSEVDGDFTLVIAGDGPERQRLEKLAERLGVVERVRFVGWQENLASLLEASEIFVLPSYSEGMPMALVEAMAHGCACVVTDIGLPVEKDREALVVPPGDAKALGEAIRALIRDKRMRRTLGENARSRALREYSWSRAAEEYACLFRELVKS